MTTLLMPCRSAKIPRQPIGYGHSPSWIPAYAEMTGVIVFLRIHRSIASAGLVGILVGITVVDFHVSHASSYRSFATQFFEHP